MKNVKPSKHIEPLRIAATAKTANIISAIFLSATFLFCASPVAQAQDGIRTDSAPLAANQPDGQGKAKTLSAPAASRESDEALSLLGDAGPEKAFDKLKNNWKDYDFTKTQIEEFKTQLPPKLQLAGAENPQSIRANRIGKKAFAEFGLLNRGVLVYESEMPLVALWKGYYVLVSSEALDLLNDAEILALIAHELGHLYFMEELRSAIENKNSEAMRVIELKCDLVAMMCLSSLKLPPGSAVDALTKMTERALALKRLTDTPSHPAILERRNFYERAKTRFAVKPC